MKMGSHLLRTIPACLTIPYGGGERSSPSEAGVSLGLANLGSSLDKSTWGRSQNKQSVLGTAFPGPEVPRYPGTQVSRYVELLVPRYPSIFVPQLRTFLKPALIRSQATFW